jgi:hypothetical protein
MRGAKLGPPRSPLHASPRHQRPPARMLRAHRRDGAAAAPVSARARRGQSDGMLSASPHNEARPSAQRQPPRRGSARSPDHASPSVCAARRRPTLPTPAPTRRCAGFPLAAMSWLPGTLRLCRRRVLPGLSRRAATRHLAWVRGMGFLRRAGPSDVQAVPRRHGLLVQLLRGFQRGELRSRTGILCRHRRRPSKRHRCAGTGNGELPPALGTGSRLAAGPSAPPPSPPTGADINAQLAQARELEAKLAEEYRTVRLLRASMAVKPPRAANARVTWAGRP